MDETKRSFVPTIKAFIVLKNIRIIIFTIFFADITKKLKNIVQKIINNRL